MGEIEYSDLFNLEIIGDNSCLLENRLEKLDYLKSMLEIMLEENNNNSETASKWHIYLVTLNDA